QRAPGAGCWLLRDLETFDFLRFRDSGRAPLGPRPVLGVEPDGFVAVRAAAEVVLLVTSSEWMESPSIPVSWLIAALEASIMLLNSFGSADWCSSPSQAGSGTPSPAGVGF